MTFPASLDQLLSDVFAHVGREAVFRPAAGLPVACQVELDAPDVTAGLGDALAVTGDATLRVVAASLKGASPAPKTPTAASGAWLWNACGGRAREVRAV